jgi:hypothetical protein
MFSRFRRYGFNYDLNLLWFLFKCMIFTYNCTDLCFMCCYSVIMFYCFPVLNVSKFKVCIMLIFDAFLRVLWHLFLFRFQHLVLYGITILEYWKVNSNHVLHILRTASQDTGLHRCIKISNLPDCEAVWNLFYLEADL